MSNRRKWMAGVICVLVALLAPAALAVDFVGGGPYTVDYPIVDYWNTINDATVDFIDGSSIAFGYLVASDGVVVNIYDCAFASGSILMVTIDGVDPAFDADVTFHGTEFAVNGTPLDATTTEIFLANNTLSGLNANGEYFEVIVQCYEEFGPGNIPVHTTINLEWLGGPSVIDVIVDIKPDSADNTVNLGSLGVIPVGILSTADFDATQVDPWTVELAGAGVAVRGKGSKLLSSIKDLNGDGLLDLEVKVETENLDPGQFQDGLAVLTGQTYGVTEGTNGGQEIQGQDTIIIVPE